MRATLVVFPVRGRSWCFGRSLDRSCLDSALSPTPSTLRELYGKMSAGGNASKLELCVDFVSDKVVVLSPLKFESRFARLGAVGVSGVVIDCEGARFVILSWVFSLGLCR